MNGLDAVRQLERDEEYGQRVREYAEQPSQATAGQSEADGAHAEDTDGSPESGKKEKADPGRG
jgi:hypothetical protein